MEPTTMFHPSLDGGLLHQRQQSQDSGAFIDWNSEDSGSPTGLTEEFVTVVSVESKEIPSPFVTVLEIGDEATRPSQERIEEVLVYRLPGERLGFGLKFEGGQNTAEKVRRLFIQSSAPDSPASRAKCSWGSLVEGDEILEIDGHSVNNMTRLDCVSFLKDSNVVIRLVVKHTDEIQDRPDVLSISTPTVISAEMKKRSPPPPPIPPRKVPRKVPALPPKGEIPPQINTSENAQEDNRHLEPIYSPVPKARSVQPEHKALTRISSNPKDSPDTVKGVVRRNSLRNVPPEAEVYLDLIAHEDEIRSNWGSESDDTASTISTIVGNPVNSNSLSDLPFNSDFLFSKLSSDKEPDSVSCDDRYFGQPGEDGLTLQPPLSFQDAPLSYGNEEVRPSIDLQEAEDELFMSSLKNYPEETLDEVDLSLDGPVIENKSMNQTQQKKISLIPRLAKSLGLISPPKPSPRKEIPVPTKPRLNKKRPPPPPPPIVTDQEVTSDSQAKSLKSSIPYLKKKKSKDDDRKANKLEKKAKKKLTEKEEAIAPYFEEPSPEGEEEPKLCWPVPDLPRDDSEVSEVFLPEQNMEFGVEAVSSLCAWGAPKQLETIGEDEEEICEEEPTIVRYVTPPAPPPRDMSKATKIAEEAPGISLSVSNSQEDSSGFVMTFEEACCASLDFLNEERKFSSAENFTVTIANAEGNVCDDISDVGELEDRVTDETEETEDVTNAEEAADRETTTEDSAATSCLNEEPSNCTGGGISDTAPPVVPAAPPSSDGDLEGEMDTVAVPPLLGSSIPPPPFNRMPPDGHEFPPKYRDEMPGKTVSSEGLKAVPPLPSTEPPRRLAFQPGKGKGVPGWRQDERSVKSVRDKIAMFQSVPDAPVSPTGYSKLCKFKSSEDVLCDEDDRSLPQTKAFSRSVLSMDKIGGGYGKGSYSSNGDSGGEFGGRAQSTMDLTSSSSSAYSSSCSPDSSLSSTTSSYLGYSSTLPRKMSSNTNYEGKTGGKVNGITRTSSFNIHNRSQSMLDINPPPYGKSRDDDNKQAALNTMVEHRRKNMSKLRGLVIPEKSNEPLVMSQPILDLPEIKSRDLILPSKHRPNEKERRTSVGCYPASSAAPSTNLLSPPWKLQSHTPAIPKYSPAFKRKNISVYGSSKNDYLDRYSVTTPSKPARYNGVSPRYSFDSSRPLMPDSTSEYGNDKIQRHAIIRPNDFPKSIDFFGKKDRNRSEEDSDNDSAVSSSRSSISPPASPLLGIHQALSPMDVEKTPVARTLSSETTASGTSTASTLTSGSHASCSSDSESQGKRILKPQSVEAINRKNVLTSAKYSRGFDGKCGSPLIQRKMLEDMLSKKHTDEVDYTEMYLDKHSYDNANNNNNKDIVCYTLAENYKSLNRVPEVKIAFLNHVECPDEFMPLKTKAEEMESTSLNFSKNVPLPIPRRVSMPTYTGSTWSNDSTIVKTDSNGHIPLTPTMSSESIRSRASSADTIVERPIALEAEIVPSRLRTLQSEAASESESSVIEDNAESGPEDNNSPRFSTARSSIGSDSVSSGWSYRASETVDSSGEYTVPSVRNSRPSIDTDSLLQKRGSSGSLLDDDIVEPEKRNGRVTSERLNARNRRSVSVNDIRKAFEKAEATKAVPEKVNGTHARVSSLDSTTSDDSGSNLHREQFGSITSLASSTSLISPQELQSLIDEANLTLEEATSGGGVVAAGSHDVLVVILHRDSVGASVGITLAGGADYESKEITVHKVLAGSPADRDGRIQKGDRVLSINGRSMKGCTHRESLAILKAPRPEVVLVVSRLKTDCADTASIDEALTSGLRSSLNGGSIRPPRILEGSLLNEPEAASGDDVARGPPTALQLVKDGAGLGFSLEGGKDSPLGDKPLVVKKIFTGGAAEKSGLLKAGDQILNVNGVDVSQMSRIDAWKLMKRLPDGNVAITVRRTVENMAA